MAEAQTAEMVTALLMGWEAQLHRIMDLHSKIEADGGMTDGTCAECNHIWPCPTYHVAAGWGLDSFYECEDAHWCYHAGVRL